MEGYLGEFSVDPSTTEFKDFTPSDWALRYIFTYGQIDGAHHKQWVLDQVVRILTGTPIEITEARWSNGHKEYRCQLGTSKAYKKWVKEYENDGEYEYDEGIPP
jgi:hypothetical protein